MTKINYKPVIVGVLIAHLFLNKHKKLHFLF